MMQVKCTKKFRNKNGKIVGYRIAYANGSYKDITADELKDNIRNGQLCVVNLTLTSDNRLIGSNVNTVHDNKASNRNKPVSHDVIEILPGTASYSGGANKLEYGKRYTWDEIATTYPNMYAIITDVVKEHEEIKTCKLLEIVSFEEEELTVHKYKQAKIHFNCVRTTFAVPNVGVLL